MDRNYWDSKASGYEEHMQRSREAYCKIIELAKKEVAGSHTLLDIGTGTGVIPVALSAYADKIHAVDYSPEMIKIARSKAERMNIRNITFQVQDCQNLSFNDNMFDVIVVSNLLHIITTPVQFLLSLKRILKEDGKIIIPTYMHNENMQAKIISGILKMKGHPVITRFSSKSFLEMTAQCGYTVETVSLIKNAVPVLYAVLSK